MASVESDRMTGGPRRLKPWQALVALAIGTAIAGIPTAAVPLAAGPAAVGGSRETGAATALVVEAVLRVTAVARPAEGGIVTS